MPLPLNPFSRRIKPSGGGTGTDAPAELENTYLEKWKPAYTMAVLDEGKRAAVNAFLAAHLKTRNPPLPSSVVTDGSGRVLAVVRGVPTLSVLRKLASHSPG